MKLQVHPREWGPLQRAAAFVAAAAVVGLGIWLGRVLWPGPCGDDLEEDGGECVGVTAHAFPVEDPEVRRLLKAIEHQNNEVREKHRSYVRVALTMPFTYEDGRSENNTSALTKEMIRHALAGTLVAQKRVNSEQRGLHLQVLPAPVGKNLDKWGPVLDWLRDETDTETMNKNKKTPLVGVTGMPSSTNKTRKAVNALSERQIPTIGPLVSSTDMKAGKGTKDYFFKTSPNNEEFVEALRMYLDRHPGHGDAPKTKRGILVYDREEDAYAQDLRRAMRKEFRGDWGVDGRRVEYSGITARGKGFPQGFGAAQDEICGSEEVDTIFFSGRDQDLPGLIKSLNEGRCEGKSLRILKVGTGFDPSLTSEATLHNLDKAEVTLVDASSVDTGWWDREDRVPPGVDDFKDEFEELEGFDLAADLDDGYAAMAHDGLWALAETVKDSHQEIVDANSEKVPSKDDVYNTLGNSSFDTDRCQDCFEGAGGTYGLGDSGTERWAVCKPVPVLELRPRTGSEPEPVDSLYRTYQDRFKEQCPRDSEPED